MPLQIHPPPSETTQQIREAILAALPGARVDVQGGGGHFELHVISSEFAGKNRLAQQRLVYAAIAHLMQGENAPVHAVDRLQTQIP